MRIFLAIPLPDPVTAALQELQAALPAGRPVAPDNLHLTLAFLDEHPRDAITELHRPLAALQQQRFEITLSGLDTYGGKHPKLLFVRAESGDPLTQLRKSVCKAVRAAGISLPRETFRPHVTLARFARHTPPRTSRRLADFLTAHAGYCLPPFTVTRFCLYHSTLLPGGATHEVLADYPLI